MFNTSRVLDYVKSSLGFPFVQIELTDEQIMDYIKTYTLREFSQYVPWVKKIPMNLQLESLKVADRQNEYYIFVNEGEEIMNVAEIYYPNDDLYFYGHPVLGPVDHYGLREFAYQAVTAMDVKMYSSYDRTFEFIHPNIVRISPVNAIQTQYVTVEAEMIQPSDFSKIPNEFQVLFCKFAAADIKIRLFHARSKYQNLRTPFGEINLNLEAVQEGKEEKRELLEKLENRSLPNCTIEIG